MFNLLLAIIYLSFISLGLPDGLLGAAWPTMYPEFNVPVSYSGLIFIIISGGTIISSLLSDRLTRKLGAGIVTAISVALTTIALFGFGFSNSFICLCLWSIPYGIGAGGVDAALNNYVALHYSSKHMSWLHCMWGLGATVGPYIMGYILSGGGIWNSGYKCVGIIQILLTGVLIFSLPLWKKSDNIAITNNDSKINNDTPLSIKKIISIPGAKAIMITFFCYCSLEQTAGLWASSYLVLFKKIDPETAATFASLFYFGITFGRFISGFITMKLSDTAMIRLGFSIICLGVILLLIPGSDIFSLIGFIIIGLGCAPVYPCIIHSTPVHFGADKSQAMVGIQMASAYIGNCTIPPLFGIIANHLEIKLLPLFLLIILLIMTVCHEIVVIKTKHN